MTPSPPSPDATEHSWSGRYARGRAADAERTRREYWADMDSGWIMVTELVTATFLWGGIGWLVDRWLGTGPWLMVLGFVVGNAAGFYLLYARSTGRIGKPGERPAPGPPAQRESGAGSADVVGTDPLGTAPGGRGHVA